MKIIDFKQDIYRITSKFSGRKTHRMFYYCATNNSKLVNIRSYMEDDWY